MNAPKGMQTEWRRLDLLGACVNSSRQGIEISTALQNQLSLIQDEVESSRRQSPWTQLQGQGDLDPMDRDILACVLAPDAEPRLGWMYQTLQPAVASAYPTAALVRELLFLTPQETIEFQSRLQPGAPLLRHGLLQPANGDAYQPLRAAPRALKMLLGWSTFDGLDLPGAIEIPSLARWEDLILPSASLQALRDYLLWIDRRDVVFGLWGARPAGGPVALFAGPSGTGKTLAAEVLANAIGYRLFRVDLGLLVSKYVGETEKNLTQLFHAASGRRILLLFDEADSLFGKRGEVHDARDRYANMEVSHLLTHIERHVGPCVLTTNLRQQLDSAFTRRFQTVVEFIRPDAAHRAALWRCHLPPRAPLAEEVEPDILAQIALTGGQIRNAALHAAFLAAGDATSIGLRHLARAVLSEMSKDGREITAANLAALADHLPGTRPWN